MTIGKEIIVDPCTKRAVNSLTVERGPKAVPHE